MLIFQFLRLFLGAFTSAGRVRSPSSGDCLSDAPRSPHIIQEVYATELFACMRHNNSLLQ